MQTEMYPDQVKRPSSSSREVVKAAADIHAVRMHEKWSEWSAEEWSEGLARHHAPHKDGYEMAKDMERDGFAPDAEMVSDLDDFSFEVSRAHGDAVRAWVRECGFEPEFAIGQDVDMGDRMGRRERYGKVSGIRHETAEYEVKTEADDGSTYIIRSENLSPVK